MPHFGTNHLKHDALIELFRKALEDKTQETAMLRQLNTPFTIQTLFKTVCEIDPKFTQLSYYEFRKLLYDNPTNELLSVFGALFVVSKNYGHIDRNLYSLELDSAPVKEIPPLRSE